MPASKFKIERKCEVCGKTFLAKTIYSKYCSGKCSDAAYRQKKRDEKKEQQRKEIAGRVPDDRPYISIQEAVALFGISRDTVYRLIRKGTIPAINIGQRLTRISRTDLETMFSRNETTGTPAMEDITPENSYSIGEISQKFAISASTVYKAIKNHHIPTRQIGKYVYVPKTDIDSIFKTK